MLLDPPDSHQAEFGLIAKHPFLYFAGLNPLESLTGQSLWGLWAEMVYHTSSVAQLLCGAFYQADLR